MAVYDLEEQEQIDEFKAWWNQYRNIVTLLVVAVLLTLTGMQGWRYYQNRQALDAGTLYLQMQPRRRRAHQFAIDREIIERHPLRREVLLEVPADARARQM